MVVIIDFAWWVWLCCCFGVWWICALGAFDFSVLLYDCGCLIGAFYGCGDRFG